MRLCLILGPAGPQADAVVAGLVAARDRLRDAGCLLPRALGRKAHVRLAVAALDCGQVTHLRHARGYGPEDQHARLGQRIRDTLADEVAAHAPQTLVICAPHLAEWMRTRSALDRLRSLLPAATDIDLVAVMPPPAVYVRDHYTAQGLAGRTSPLAADLDLATRASWPEACRARAARLRPDLGLFADTESAPLAADAPALREDWLRIWPQARWLWAPPDDRLPGFLGDLLSVPIAMKSPPPPVSARTLARMQAAASADLPPDAQ